MDLKEVNRKLQNELCLDYDFCKEYYKVLKHSLISDIYLSQKTEDLCKVKRLVSYLFYLEVIFAEDEILTNNLNLEFSKEDNFNFDQIINTEDRMTRIQMYNNMCDRLLVDKDFKNYLHQFKERKNINTFYLNYIISSSNILSQFVNLFKSEDLDNSFKDISKSNNDVYKISRICKEINSRLNKVSSNKRIIAIKTNYNKDIKLEQCDYTNLSNILNHNEIIDFCRSCDELFLDYLKFSNLNITLNKLSELNGCVYRYDEKREELIQNINKLNTENKYLYGFDNHKIYVCKKFKVIDVEKITDFFSLAYIEIDNNEPFEKEEITKNFTELSNHIIELAYYFRLYEDLYGNPEIFDNIKIDDDECKEVIAEFADNIYYKDYLLNQFDEDLGDEYEEMLNNPYIELKERKILSLYLSEYIAYKWIFNEYIEDLLDEYGIENIVKATKDKLNENNIEILYHKMTKLFYVVQNKDTENEECKPLEHIVLFNLIKYYRILISSMSEKAEIQFSYFLDLLNRYEVDNNDKISERYRKELISIH